MGFLTSLARAAIGLVVESPIAVVADVLTLGGAITEAREPYTATALKRVARNVSQATKPESTP